MKRLLGLVLAVGLLLSTTAPVRGTSYTVFLWKNSGCGGPYVGINVQLNGLVGMLSSYYFSDGTNADNAVSSVSYGTGMPYWTFRWYTGYYGNGYMNTTKNDAGADCDNFGTDLNNQVSSFKPVS
jgi:hypothetical protein